MKPRSLLSKARKSSFHDEAKSNFRIIFSHSIQIVKLKPLSKIQNENDTKKKKTTKEKTIRQRSFATKFPQRRFFHMNRIDGCLLMNCEIF
jgi:hypothetical protein